MAAAVAAAHRSEPRGPGSDLTAADLIAGTPIRPPSPMRPDDQCPTRPVVRQRRPFVNRPRGIGRVGRVHFSRAGLRRWCRRDRLVPQRDDPELEQAADRGEGTRGRIASSAHTSLPRPAGGRWTTTAPVAIAVMPRLASYSVQRSEAAADAASSSGPACVVPDGGVGDRIVGPVPEDPGVAAAAGQPPFDRRMPPLAHRLRPVAQDRRQPPGRREPAVPATTWRETPSPCPPPSRNTKARSGEMTKGGLAVTRSNCSPSTGSTASQSQATKSPSHQPMRKTLRT
jgi:hypothetical protein